MTLFPTDITDHLPAGNHPPPGCVAVRVAVERGIEHLGEEAGLSYFAPEGIELGERVEVPLGRANRGAHGIVTEIGSAEITAGVPPGKVKSILRRTGATLSPSMVELARWMAGYYVCPLGMVLATMMPAAVKRGVGLKERVLVARAESAAPRDLKLTPRAKQAWDRVQGLDAGLLPMPARDLARAVGASSVAPINRLVKSGLLRQVIRKEVAAATDWDGLGVESHTPASEVPPRPTPEQLSAIDGIATSLGSFAVHLLRGVTGSGKTEVYLRVIERVLTSGGEHAGGSALVLVPEIALTPQTAGRFVRRFRGQGVAVLHSGLTASQRHKQWALAASGAARVVVGARSAVFAPLENLALIVVDEEHDSSYKQDQLPRFHARDLAIKRAQMGRFPVVLGSATPSLESWHNATGAFGPNRSARYNLWELRGRVPGTALPHTEIVDIAAENRARALGHVSRRPSAGGRIEQIGPTLERAMQHTLASDGQIILLLNRRGYANYIACPSARCGWLMQCDSCDAMMVFHKSLVVDRAGTGGFVRCHHCLAEKLLPRNCPSCQAKLNVFGAGTQRLEEELAAKFAGVPTLRIDSDSMRSGRDYFQALARFARAEVKILLGTQMIAKGLDFPGVRLVGVVNADTALSIPDFRAAERTFQLVSQVAGRAGRGKEAGRVIVQTCSMNLPAIRYAANHDYVGFATDELRVRREAGLPPITKMARIVVRDGTCEKAEGAAKSLGVALHAAALSSGMDRVRIDGPGPSPVGRIADQFRFELLITSTRRSEIQTLLAGLRARGLLTSDAHTAVDIDPVSLM